MRGRLQKRLGELHKEFDTGRLRLQDLERQQASLRETLLRIGGAIQVLEELLAEQSYSDDNSVDSSSIRATPTRTGATEPTISISKHMTERLDSNSTNPPVPDDKGK